MQLSSEESWPLSAQSPLALACRRGQSCGTEVAEKPLGGPKPIRLTSPRPQSRRFSSKSELINSVFCPSKPSMVPHFLQDTVQTPGVPEAGGQTLHDWTPAWVFKLVFCCSPTTMVPGGDLSGPVPLHKLSPGPGLSLPSRGLFHAGPAPASSPSKAGPPCTPLRLVSPGHSPRV